MKTGMYEWVFLKIISAITIIIDIIRLTGDFLIRVAVVLASPVEGRLLEPNLIAFAAAISACDKGSLWQCGGCKSDKRIVEAPICNIIFSIQNMFHIDT